MQKVIQRTALARNQAKRKAIRATKNTQREEFKQYLKQQFAYKRSELDNLRAERERRREDWLRGPLAPKRDAGPQAKYYGAFEPFALHPPKIPKHLRRKFINFAPGDRVCVIRGRETGKISEITRVDPETETVTLQDLNEADVQFPDWLSEAHGRKQPVQTLNIPVPMDDIRLVVALDDPETGNTRDTLVEHVYGGEPFLEREYLSNIPKHTRYIAGENIEIPWPRDEPPSQRDQDWDTLRMEVETPTWVPSLKHAPFPPSVMDELRNKFSKYRTRHDPEWVEAKKVEDYRREYLQSRSLLTPVGEFLAMKRAQKDESKQIKRDADGNPIMSPETVDFIERFMKQKAQKNTEGTV